MRTSAKDLERDQSDTEEPQPGQEAEGQRVVPRLKDEPARFRQDTQVVNGDTATHLPPETDLDQRPTVQG